jgi:hypothetical protein
MAPRQYVQQAAARLLNQWAEREEPLSFSGQ